jgi:hypothetical protein
LPPRPAGRRAACREDFYDRGDYAPIGKHHRERIVYVADGHKSGWVEHSAEEMESWACRLFIRITSITVQRVCEIGEADAAASGVERIELGPWDVGGMPVHPMTSSYADAFRDWWDRQHGAGAWEKDWAFRVECQRVEQPSEKE